jgi:hypothetical protein
MGTLLRALACSVSVSCVFASGALTRDNFYELTQREGCESVMASLRSKCIDLNDKKDAACKAEGSCDLQKHTEQIAQYQADVARLDAGTIADADRDAFKARIEATKTDLDQHKSEAEANEKAARACIDARMAVYDFFEKEVIPGTQQAAAKAKDEREALLKELDNAEVLVAAAKDKRDDLADADPEKDRERYEEYVKMQGEYDKNAEAYRQAEGKLGDFNTTYGNDIDDNLRRLINYYTEQQKGHNVQIEAQKDRSEKCAKVENMSY